MKLLKQFFVLIVVAFVGLAVVGCKEDDPPPEEPVATTADLKLGEINITLKYKKKPSDPVPAYVARIQERLTTMASSTAQSAVNLINNLNNRGGNYSINVIYDGESFDAFLATDGQTLKAHDTWLTTNAETISGTQLMTGFNAMLALPAVTQ